MECCETFPGGLPRFATDTGVRFKDSTAKAGKHLRSTYQTQDAGDDEGKDESLDLYYLWSRMVEKYTRTSLTYQKDRLVAIHGLGRYFNYLLDKSLLETGSTPARKSEMYTAGLWMAILLRSYFGWLKTIELWPCSMPMGYPVTLQSQKHSGRSVHESRLHGRGPQSLGPLSCQSLSARGH